MRNILAAKPSITQLEIDYVTDAVTNGWGTCCYDYLKKLKETLQNYYDVKYACPTSSCHGALHIVLKALGIGCEDEVIVPDITWVGSVFPITWLGAKPVFVDVLPDSWCIDPERVVAAITPKTKAIIVVHLYGNLVEMDEIIKIAEDFNIPVIEDFAEAVGSEYKKRRAGGIADIGVFSMHGTKTLTAGEGGAIITSREDLAKKISIIENLGRYPDKHIMYWVDEVGLKYKMSNLQAALATAQFERVDILVERKRCIFSRYKELFSNVPDITMNIEQDYCKNSYWMPTVVFGKSWNFNRDALVRQMCSDGIAIRPFFYPVSMLPMYENASENLVAYRLYDRGINLPSYYDMSEDDLEHVVENMLLNLGRCC